MRIRSTSWIVFALWSSSAFSQMIVKHEPPIGTGMRSGESVLVDDGKCPKGQLLKVTAGVSYGGRNQASGAGTGRTRECVPRP